jgi:hypothetical protein
MAGWSCSTCAVAWRGRKAVRRSLYRATVAPSLLAAAGRDVVAVEDEFDNAAAAGLPLERPQAAAG